MWYWLIACGLVIIIVLAYYAGQMLWQLKQQKTEIELKKQQQKNKRIQFIVDSILFIAKAMKAQQCEYSEGVLRICSLLEHYNNEQEVTEDFTIQYLGFYQLYEEIKDQPTHSARKQLSKKELREMDYQRLKKEQAFKAQIDLDIESLLSSFPRAG